MIASEFPGVEIPIEESAQTGHRVVFDNERKAALRRAALQDLAAF